VACYRVKPYLIPLLEDTQSVFFPQCRRPVSDPYETSGKAIVKYTVFFSFLVAQRKTKYAEPNQPFTARPVTILANNETSVCFVMQILTSRRQITYQISNVSF
jgi:hypothetical protein